MRDVERPPKSCRLRLASPAPASLRLRLRAATLPVACACAVLLHAMRHTHSTAVTSAWVWRCLTLINYWWIEIGPGLMFKCTILVGLCSRARKLTWEFSNLDSRIKWKWQFWLVSLMSAYVIFCQMIFKAWILQQDVPFQLVSTEKWNCKSFNKDILLLSTSKRYQLEVNIYGTVTYTSSWHIEHTVSLELLIQYFTSLSSIPS